VPSAEVEQGQLEVGAPVGTFFLKVLASDTALRPDRAPFFWVFFGSDDDPADRPPGRVRDGPSACHEDLPCRHGRSVRVGRQLITAWAERDASTKY